MKKNFSLPLFWKFTIAIVLVVALFGSINLYFINYALFDLSNKEINRHGITTAKVIAERSVDPILYNDIPFLDKIVSDNLKIDTSIAYILILDKSNKVLAHTFKENIPSNLIGIQNVRDYSEDGYIRIVDKNDPDKIVREMSIPILNGNLGQVRVGVYEENFINSTHSINSFFLSMVALFLFFGILGAFIFSYIITFPIKKISKISETLNLDSLEMLKDNEKLNGLYNSVLKIENKFKVTDEIDVLSNKFNEMIIRLQNAYTELKNAQESLMQSEKIAAIGTLSAGIAHEINNPIAGIQNCLNRISKNPENIKQNIVYIELMDEAIVKIKTVVQELLNFSRKHDISFIEVNIVELIEKVLLLIAYQLEKSRISIVKNYPKVIPLILGSPNHIEQVLLNLLINAIDAINELKNINKNINGKISIAIETNEKYLRILIKDNGIGLDEDKIKQMFDPFFTLKKIKQGTGLGLTVSLNIIKEHQGYLRAQKNQDNGLTFIIDLPFNRE